MPFWLKAVMVVAGVFIVGSIVVAAIGWVLHSVLYIAIGAVAVGALYIAYHRFMMSIPAYRRRQLQKKRDY
jgi:hypothetical protein